MPLSSTSTVGHYALMRSKRPSVRLSISVCPMHNGAFYGYDYYRILIGNPMLEFEHIGQRSGRNNCEAVAGAAS